MAAKRKFLYIDETLVEFNEGQTILEVAKESQIYIPTLCYIKELLPYGGCRLCLVRVEGIKGFPPACTTPAEEGMIILTNDNELQDLRREVMKLIMSEHPHSCIVCNSRSECEDLKRPTNKSGRVFGCFSCPNNDDCDLKAVTDYLGLKTNEYELEYKNYSLERDDPFFERDYSLCVLCGKCVRVCNDLRGIGAINFINRGHDTRVSTGVNQLHIETNCQFCGACIDKCPTGALSTKNTKWSNRTDNYVSSHCNFCNIGCGFKYYNSKGKITDSVPNETNPLSNGQACVIGRFCTPIFNNDKERLRYPMVKRINSLSPTTWDEVFHYISEKLKQFKPEEIAFLLSPDLSNESAYLINKFANESLKTNQVSLLSDDENINILYDFYEKYKILSSKRPLENIDLSNWILLINSDVQISHPVLLIKLKQARDKGAKIISLNLNNYKLPFETKKLVDEELTLTEKELIDYLIANEKEFRNQKGSIIFGNLMKLSNKFTKDLIDLLLNLYVLPEKDVNLIPLWNRNNTEGVFQIISEKNRTTSLELFQKIRDGKIKALYLTERVKNAELLQKVDLVIIQDIFPSDNFKYADVVLPSCTFLEQSGSILNSELKIVKSEQAAYPPDKALPDWKILSDLAKIFDEGTSQTFNYTDSNEILEEILENNHFFSDKSNSKLKDLGKKEQIHLSPDGSYLKTPEKAYSLNSIEYRGEKISNRVSDLNEIISFRQLKESDKKEEKPEQVKITSDYKVISNKEIAPNFYELVIEVPLIAKKAKPGNFVILMKDEQSEKTPLTISNWDESKGTITIYFQEAGFSTKKFTELKDGDYIFSVVGPLGNEISFEKYGTVLLGGGCYGNGAILPLAEAAKKMGNRVIIILESRNRNLFYLEEEFKEVADEIIYCTSDGSKGLQGKIQDGLEYVLNRGEKIDRSYFIGCNMMMKNASKITKLHKIPTYVSLSTIMIDGTGMCGGCRLTLIEDGKEITKFACVDGPIFDGHKVNWESLTKRSAQYKEPEILVFQNHSCRAIEKMKVSNFY
jgi:NADH dehydrogenase/NADH:ubiquinone oxidoreductase subunit G/NAD(P)H-flavin reductase